jgi:hypothetical protein
MFVLQSLLTVVSFFIHNAMQTVIILLVIVFDCFSECMRIIIVFNSHQSVTRIDGVMVSVLSPSVVVWILALGPSKPKTMKLVFVASALSAQH